MSVNVLPDMDGPRLKALGKQLNRSRKSSLIGIGKDKQKLDVYVKSLNKEKRSLDGKYHVRGTRLKKSLANVRGTQKVLKARKEQSFWEDSEEYPYGVYEGESLDSYRREIEQVINDKHPRLRRMRKVEDYMKTGRIMGRIMDNDDARDEFNEIMVNGRRKRNIRRENPLTRTFLQHTCQYRRSGTMDHLWKNPNVKNQMRLKPTYDSGEDTDDYENPSPLGFKINGKSQGMARLHSPRTLPDSQIESPVEFKWKRRLNALRKSPISLESPQTDVSNDFSEDDYVTVKSSPSKLLNLPPLTVNKNSVKQSQAYTTNINKNIGIRRVTKGDLRPALSMENLQKFEKLKNQRATTFL